MVGGATRHYKTAVLQIHSLHDHGPSTQHLPLLSSTTDRPQSNSVGSARSEQAVAWHEPAQHTVQGLPMSSLGVAARFSKPDARPAARQAA